MVDEVDPWTVPGADVFALLMGKDVVVQDISGEKSHGVLIFRDARRLILRTRDGRHKAIRRGKYDANISSIEENGADVPTSFVKRVLDR